jgi:hypothetical protein
MLINSAFESIVILMQQFETVVTVSVRVVLVLMNQACVNGEGRANLLAQFWYLIWQIACYL